MDDQQPPTDEEAAAQEQPKPVKLYELIRLKYRGDQLVIDWNQIGLDEFARAKRDDPDQSFAVWALNADAGVKVLKAWVRRFGGTDRLINALQKVDPARLAALTAAAEEKRRFEQVERAFESNVARKSKSGKK